MGSDRAKQMTMRLGTLSMLAAVLAAVGWGQSISDQFPLRQQSPGSARSSDEAPPFEQDLLLRQVRLLREQRQKEMFSDTNRLLQLATELKAQVDRANKPTPDELKDVDEIGKLAKRVSERIKSQ